LGLQLGLNLCSCLCDVILELVQVSELEHELDLLVGEAVPCKRLGRFQLVLQLQSAFGYHIRRQCNFEKLFIDESDLCLLSGEELLLRLVEGLGDLEND